ncbi:MAG TPA: glycosyltransferase, partial [Polyangiaceae bacterium]|nr:glycosyltransferase [Polyangiaceae bacterium]
MNVAFFCHSLLSDWNNGNAHFLRGLVSELARMGHRVHAFEPHDAWSLKNLLEERPDFEVAELSRYYPELEIEHTDADLGACRATIKRYDLERFELERALDGVELVIVHEWNEPELIRRLSALRRRAGCRFRVLFHDTHHRSSSDSDAIARMGIEEFDGVLAFGEAVRQRYLKAGWAK